MRIKPLIKHYLFLFVILLFVVYIDQEIYTTIYITRYDPAIILIVLVSISFFYYDRCPKCKHKVGFSKSGWTTFQSSKYCYKCGQDLMKCEIESDEEIEKRKKK